MTIEERLIRIETLVEIIHNDVKEMKADIKEHSNDIEGHAIRIDRVEQTNKKQGWLIGAAISGLLIAIGQWFWDKITGKAH